MSSIDSEGEEPSPETLPRSSARKHLSESLHVEHWTRLIIILTAFLLMLLTVAVSVRLMTAMRHTLLIFSLGGLVAYALDPLVELIHKKLPGRKGRLYSVFILFGSLAIVMFLGMFFFGREMVHQASLLGSNHPQYQRDMRDKLYNVSGWLHEHGVPIDLHNAIDNPPPNVRLWSEELVKNAPRYFLMAGKDIAEGFVVMLIALYFLIYSEEMHKSVSRALPGRYRAYVEQWQDDMNRILGGFVRGQLVLALIIGALAAAGCFLLGIKLWLLIGLFVVFAALIPVVGPLLGAIPAVIAAVITPDGVGMFHPVTRVILVVVAFGVINEVGSKILYPRLVGAALGLHEVLVLFILFAGFEVSGLTGVLFAAPLTALSVVTLTHLYRMWQGLPPISVANVARDEGQLKKVEGTP